MPALNKRIARNVFYLRFDSAIRGATSRAQVGTGFPFNKLRVRMENKNSDKTQQRRARSNDGTVGDVSVSNAGGDADIPQSDRDRAGM